MYIINPPTWINQFNYPYKRFEEIPVETFECINTNLRHIQSDTPDVSILISAWNEEINILKCIASLSQMKTTIPFEIVVVNNNSTDKTQNVLDKLHVKNYFQGIQGWGPARQLAQEKARGKYILLGDADCLYPDCWVDEMIRVLKKPNVVCVYGRYSFIPEKKYPRWKLFTLEKMKDIIAEFRQLKRPFLNAYGISMGYIKEYGLQIGFVMYKARGEDGRLCLSLMKYGKIKQVRTEKARAWTGVRTLSQDGNITLAIKKRISYALKSFGSFFITHKAN